MTQPNAPRTAPTVTERLLAAAAWTTGLAWALPATSTLMALQTIWPADRIDRLTRIYTRGQLLAVGTRVRYVTDPAIDPARPYMFAANHINHLDNCTMYDSTPHFKQGLENEDHFRYPFYGWFMKQRGTIPVRPKSPTRLDDLREHMRAEIGRGHSILVFPEGTRTRTGEVGPFRSGVFLLARDLGLPIVPVSVCGMFEVMNPNSWVIRPGRRVTVYADAPVETAHVTDDDLRDLAEHVRGVIAGRVAEHARSGENGAPRP